MSLRVHEREEQIIDELRAAYPVGRTSGEIAEALGQKADTVRDVIRRVQQRGVPVEEPQTRRYAIDPTLHPPSIQLTTVQAWLLYTPLRRIVRSGWAQGTLVKTLLLSVARVLRRDIADVLLPSDTSRTPGSFDERFRTLVRGWENNQQVKISYQGLKASGTRTWMVEPYWFEPAPWSDSVYMIAGVGQGRVITFKLDRIHSAQLQSASFERPDPNALLAEVEKSWGIWQSDGVTVVKLRFSRQVAMRVRETRWHPQQQTTPEQDGSLLWEAPIAEPQEMIGWIRSWGPDCEVLEPQEIRKQIAADARKATGLYDKFDVPGNNDFF